MCIILFQYILYLFGQTWIDFAGKDMNFSEIRGQKHTFSWCLDNNFLMVPYENPCLNFSIRFQMSITFFELQGIKEAIPQIIGFIIVVLILNIFIELKILCYIMSIMNCKSLCLIVSKTNFVSTLAPSLQSSTMLCSTELFINFGPGFQFGTYLRYQINIFCIYLKHWIFWTIWCAQVLCI